MSKYQSAATSPPTLHLVSKTQKSGKSTSCCLSPLPSRIPAPYQDGREEEEGEEEEREEREEDEEDRGGDRPDEGGSEAGGGETCFLKKTKTK